MKFYSKSFISLENQVGYNSGGVTKDYILLLRSYGFKIKYLSLFWLSVSCLKNVFHF